MELLLLEKKVPQQSKFAPPQFSMHGQCMEPADLPRGVLLERAGRSAPSQKGMNGGQDPAHLIWSLSSQAGHRAPLLCRTFGRPAQPQRMPLLELACHIRAHHIKCPCQYETASQHFCPCWPSDMTPAERASKSIIMVVARALFTSAQSPKKYVNKRYARSRNSGFNSCCTAGAGTKRLLHHETLECWSEISKASPGFLRISKCGACAI